MYEVLLNTAIEEIMWISGWLWAICKHVRFKKSLIGLQCFTNGV